MGRLFWKFFFAFWLALLAAGISVGTMVWLRHQALDDTQRQVDLRRRAATFISAADVALRHGGVSALRELMLEWQNQPAPLVYAVDESNRELLNREMAPAILEQARRIAGEGIHSNEVRQVVGDDGHRYLLFVSFREKNPGGRSSLFRWGTSSLHHRRQPPPTLPITAGVFASLIFSAWLAWYLAKPIRTLRKAFDDLAQGRLDTRVTHLMGKRRDELADLGQDFDHMASQISTLVDAQRNLLHDVSHELRSPLARLQAAIGLARQQPEKIALTLERIERESQRLSDLVGELLTLSRLEAGVADAQEEAIDIGELLAEVIEDARFEAKVKGVRVAFDDPGEIIICGRAELLQRALENVVRNAVQYTPADRTVKVNTHIERDEHRLYLVVLDEGPGVPEAQLSAIFIPFFRGDQRHQTAGVGLGLAIARRAVEAHGGHIVARNRPDGGLSVEMNLPIAQRPSQCI